MTEKRKRMLLIAGGIVVSAGLILAIFMKAGTSRQEDMIESKAAEKNPVVVKLVPEQGESDSEEEEEKEGQSTEENRENLVIRPETGKNSGEQTMHSSDSRPPQTDQPEQSIQPDPTRSAEPEENVLKNPAQKPDGTVLTEPPVSVPHDLVGNQEETKPQPDGPQAGDTNGSQIYIPGFGWTENQGGGGSGISAGDMYENGNKIGAMD